MGFATSGFKNRFINLEYHCCRFRFGKVCPRSVAIYYRVGKTFPSNQLGYLARAAWLCRLQGKYFLEQYIEIGFLLQKSTMCTVITLVVNMLLLQIQPSDTISRSIKAISDTSEMAGIWDSFIIPLAILFFFSLIKYVTGTAFKTVVWFDFMAEMAIDVLSIFVAFVVGRYFLLSSSSDVLISNTGKIFVIVVVAIILSLFRVIVHNCMLKSKPNYWGAGAMLFLEYLFSVICIIMIFKF